MKYYYGCLVRSKRGFIINIFKNYFPLGLGTSRLPISNENDEAGIEKSTELILAALDKGVNYIDSSHIYAHNAAHTALKRAFLRTSKRAAVTIKSRYGQDFTSDDALRRIETTLEALGVDNMPFFYVWTIMCYADFEGVMKSGGIYEGAMKAKSNGLINHICFSTHAPISDSIKIIESGVFEGVTISFSLLNAGIMRPVLETAVARNIGVAVMNPLGGGLITKNPHHFDFSRGIYDDTVCQAAFRFIKAHEGVNIILSGASSKDEINENIDIIESKDYEPIGERLKRVYKGFEGLIGFCTGCNYCAECPQKIPISKIMQAKNKLLFGIPDSLSKWYNRTDLELLKNISIFDDLQKTHNYIPDTADNPCVGCRLCESLCTQKLEICKALTEMYKRMEISGYSMRHRKERLEFLFAGKGYRKVGIYPNSMQATTLIDLYEKFFGKACFEWVFFNSSGKMQKKDVIHDPSEIPNLRLDLMLIVSYKYDLEIYESIKPVCDSIGLKIEVLYSNADVVPWVFN